MVNGKQYELKIDSSHKWLRRHWTNVGEKNRYLLTNQGVYDQ